MNGGREVRIRSSLLSAARTRARLGPAGARIHVMTAERLYCQNFADDMRRVEWHIQDLKTVAICDGSLEAEGVICLSGFEETTLVVI